MIFCIFLFKFIVCDQINTAITEKEVLFDKCKELDKPNERRPNTTETSSVISNEVGSILNTVSTSLNNSTTLISTPTSDHLNIMNNPKIEIVNCSSSSSSSSSNTSEDVRVSNLNEIDITLTDKETKQAREDAKETVDRNNNNDEDLSKMLNSLNTASNIQEASK